MDKEQRGRFNFRFGLKELLIAVAICAYVAWSYSNIPTTVTREMLARVRPGDSQAVVLAELGEPMRVVDHGGGATKWYYEGNDPMYVWFENGKFAGALFESEVSFKGQPTKNEVWEMFGPPTEQTSRDGKDLWFVEINDDESWVFVFDIDGRSREMWSGNSDGRWPNE